MSATPPAKAMARRTHLKTAATSVLAPTIVPSSVFSRPAPVEVGLRSDTIWVLAHIDMKLGRKLSRNPEAERFVDDDEADRWLDFPHRKPWIL